MDNNSTDGTVEWLKEQTDIKVILNQKNKGFPAGCNQGIEAAESGNDILLLNNDTIVSPNWLEYLRSCLYSERTIGAVGPVTNSCSNLQSIKAEYIEYFLSAARNNQKNPELWEERVRLIAFCMLIRNEVVKKIGLLDELFSPGNFEDDDYSLRIRKAGYRLMLCGDCFIYHFGGASFSKDNTAFENLLKVNRNKFFLKWGVDPYLFAQDDRLILKPQLDEIKQPKNILVLNSGCGSTLLYLRKRYPEAHICGVEDNKKLIVNLDHAAEITDLNNFTLQQFDLIYVNAFLSNEQAVSAQLEKLSELLAENGTLIIAAEDDKLSGFSNKNYFKNMRCEFKNNMIVLKRMPQVSVQVISCNELACQDHSINPEDAGEEELSFLLRRLEFGLDVQQDLKNLFKVMTDKHFSINEVKAIVNKTSVNKAKAFNSIGAAYYKIALEMFIETGNSVEKLRDSACNLASLLYESGEKNLALALNEFIKEKTHHE